MIEPVLLKILVIGYCFFLLNIKFSLQEVFNVKIKEKCYITLMVPCKTSFYSRMVMYHIFAQTQ